MHPRGTISLMRMNASQAQNAYGVARRTVGRWITAGKLPVDEDGYFEEDDFKILNAKRITQPAPGRKTAIKSINKSVKKKLGQRSAAAETKPSLDEHVNARQKVDLRKALANASKAEMEVKIKMKDLISRELVSRVFRGIYAIDSTEWRGLGARLAPDIMALCEIEDPKKEVAIGNVLEREVFETLTHVKKAINSFLEDIESQDRIVDD